MSIKQDYLDTLLGYVHDLDMRGNGDCIVGKHAAHVGDLSKKLKYWDYKKVIEIHEALEMVNESINVPLQCLNVPCVA